MKQKAVRVEDMIKSVIVCSASQRAFDKNLNERYV